MTEVWLFGTFASSNNNLDPSKTSDRAVAKWRSQVKVPTGHQAFAPFQAGQTNYVIIGTSAATATVKAVYISDLEYQLRNTDPITDSERWIRSVNSGTVGGFQYIAGYRLGTQTEYTGFTYTPVATNPNPAPIVKPTPTPKSLVNLGYLSFAETRLDLGYDYGAAGGMGYGTEITEVVDGREQRNATRYLPLGRWQLGDRLVADSEKDLLAEVSYLKQFHLDRLGSFQGFRFKDWADFKAVNQDIATGNGVKTQFQLRKAYKVGNAVTYRPIQKPVVGTVDILVNGVNVGSTPNHGWVVDHATGVLSNPTPLANGAKLTANFEFDVPVWFESDEIGFRLEAYEPETEAVIYRLESVYVVEGRIPPAITWDVQKLIEITEELDLGIIYETVEQYQFSTLKQELKSGYAIRESKREESRFLVNLGDRNYDQGEVDQILAYFWNARGSLAEFPFKNLGKKYQVRFAQDQLNFKFEAASDSDKLFNLSGLKLQLKEQPVFAFIPPPFSTQLTPLYVNTSDTALNSISSSGDSIYPGSVGSPAGGTNNKPYNINSYKANSVSFSQSPPNESATGVTYKVVSLFWAAGTLHLLVTVTTAGSSSSYRDRLVHYRLNLTNGWVFEYQSASSQILRNYIVATTNMDVPKVFKTATGVSQFFRANNIPFGGIYSAIYSGLLRFEVKNDGSVDISFVGDSTISPRVWSVPYLVHGSKAWISSASVNAFVGTFNGLTYYINSGADGSTGFPITNNSSQADKEYEFNIRVSNALETGNVIKFYHGIESIFSYKPTLFSSPGFYLTSGDNGSYIVKVYVTNLCQNGQYGCSSANTTPLVYFFLKSTYDSQPVLIDVQRYLSGANVGWSSLIQTYFSWKPGCDQFGNMLVWASSYLIYYKAGSGRGINIASQLGFTVSEIRNKPTSTPYGFAIFQHPSTNIFAANAQLNLAFVQPQEINS